MSAVRPRASRRSTDAPPASWDARGGRWEKFGGGGRGRRPGRKKFGGGEGKVDESRAGSLVHRATHQHAHHRRPPPLRRGHQGGHVRGLRRAVVGLHALAEHATDVVREPALRSLGEGVVRGAIRQREPHAERQRRQPRRHLGHRRSCRAKQRQSPSLPRAVGGGHPDGWRVWVPASPPSRISLLVTRAADPRGLPEPHRHATTPVPSPAIVSPPADVRRRRRRTHAGARRAH